MLSKKLADAMVEKTAQLIEDDATCREHKGQPLVAFDKEANSFFCMQCIYEGNHVNPQFVTL